MNSVVSARSESTLPVVWLYAMAARLDRSGMGMLRLGLIVVLVWIGGLKFANYEADGIVPFVANSPLISYLYHFPAPEYRHYMNKEGEAIPAHHQWNVENGTYPVSRGLGIVIMLIAVLIASYPIAPHVSAVGSFLLILMACTTLSFLVTNPGGLGACRRLRNTWISVPFWSGPTSRQGLHHARSGCRYDG